MNYSIFQGSHGPGNPGKVRENLEKSGNLEFGQGIFDYFVDLSIFPIKQDFSVDKADSSYNYKITKFYNCYL